MTDILTLIENLAPLALLIAIPIAAVRLLDADDLRELGPAGDPQTGPVACPAPIGDDRPPAPASGRRRAERPMRPMAAMPDVGWPSTPVDG